MALVVAVAISVAGCGRSERQDKDAPSGTWTVAVEEWSFPKRQFLGTPTEFVLKIRNTDSRAIPQLIATIEGLNMRVKQVGAASEIRPIWLTSENNYAQFTAYNAPLASSFNLGLLDPGDTKTYTVTLSPLRRGTHEVGYRLAPSLLGDGKIVEGADNTPAEDQRTVVIDATPQFDDSFFDEK